MKRKGFTLIELLAVIIILGILMLIAIPSVTSYINNSRKNTYVSTIQEIIKGTVARVNNGDLDMYDTDTTYYIPAKAINLEGGRLQSPYGEIEDAYVVVTYDGESYDYYYVGKDKANMGIGEITQSDKINKDSIGEVGTIDKTVGIGGRSKVVVFDDDLIAGVSQTATIQGGSSSSGSTGTSSNFSCSSVSTVDYSNQGTVVFFDPVSDSPCSEDNEGDGTCYRWYILSEEGNKANIILDHHVGRTKWITASDYGNSTVKTDKGPITLLKNLKNATSTWTRVPMLNFSYSMSYPEDGDTRYKERSCDSGTLYETDWNGYKGYESMCCINGTCTIKDGTTIANDLRARVATSEEIADLVNSVIDYYSATPSVSQTWTSVHGLSYISWNSFSSSCKTSDDYLMTVNNVLFYNSDYIRIGTYQDHAYSEQPLRWLRDIIDDSNYNMITLTSDNFVTYNDYSSYFALSDEGYIGSWSNSSNNDALYPIVSIDKSLLTYLSE